MRRFSLVSICGLLLAAAACNDSSSSDISDPEIRSQDDVQRLFRAIVPELVEAFTELASEQLPAASALTSSADKGGDSSASQCPGGGTLSFDAAMEEAILTECTVGGVTISARLMLTITSIPPTSYRAEFSGTLNVSGTQNGMVHVVQMVIEWTDPATDDNTSWEGTVTVDGETFPVSSEDTGNGGGGSGGGGSGGGGFDFCTEAERGVTGEFVLTNGATTRIERRVCYHGRTDLGPPGSECPVYNFRIPHIDSRTIIDFTEFIDIFYGGQAAGCADEFLGEFDEENKGHYILSGTPDVFTPLPDPPAGDVSPIEASGDYFILGAMPPEQGTFRFCAPSPCTE